MPQTRVRVVGSGFTTFTYQGRILAFLEIVRDSGQAPITAPEALTPLGASHPTEIVTGRVLAEGRLDLQLRELWNEPVWYQLGLTGANNIVEVYRRLSEQPSYVTCQMVIRPPNSNVVRGKIYHNCVVTGIDDSENITVGALSIPRGIVVHYTHTSALGASGG
jgi:hypothetical protein